jgi:hypothetical protein
LETIVNVKVQEEVVDELEEGQVTYLFQSVEEGEQNNQVLLVFCRGFAYHFSEVCPPIPGGL